MLHAEHFLLDLALLLSVLVRLLLCLKIIIGQIDREKNILHIHIQAVICLLPLKLIKLLIDMIRDMLQIITALVTAYRILLPVDDHLYICFLVHSHPHLPLPSL